MQSKITGNLVIKKVLSVRCNFDCLGQSLEKLPSIFKFVNEITSQSGRQTDRQTDFDL